MRAGVLALSLLAAACAEDVVVLDPFIPPEGSVEVIEPNPPQIACDENAVWEAFEPAGTADAPRAYNDIWGSGPNDVWAVGTEGRIFRYDGSNWGRAESQTVGDLFAVHGSGPDDVWVAGRWDVLRYDGASWSSFHHIAGSDPNPSFGTLYAGAPNAVWFGGGAGMFYFDGTDLHRVPFPDHLAVVDVWGQGSRAHLVTLDHETPTGLARFFAFDGVALRAVPAARDIRAHTLAGTAPDRLWARGQYNVSEPWSFASYDGREWQPGLAPEGAGPNLAIVGDDLYLSSKEVWRLRNGAWCEETVSRGYINAIWGSGDEVWGAGLDAHQADPDTAPIGLLYRRVVD